MNKVKESLGRDEPRLNRFQSPTPYGLRLEFPLPKRGIIKSLEQTFSICRTLGTDRTPWRINAGRRTQHRTNLCLTFLPESRRKGRIIQRTGRGVYTLNWFDLEGPLFSPKKPQTLHFSLKEKVPDTILFNPLDL